MFSGLPPRYIFLCFHCNQEVYANFIQTEQESKQDGDLPEGKVACCPVDFVCGLPNPT